MLILPRLGWVLVLIICNYPLFIFTPAESFSFFNIHITGHRIYIYILLILLLSFVRCLKEYNITRHPTLINYFVIFIKYYFFFDKCAHLLILVIISRTYPHLWCIAEFLAKCMRVAYLKRMRNTDLLYLKIAETLFSEQRFRKKKIKNHVTSTNMYHRNITLSNIPLKR